MNQKDVVVVSGLPRSGTSMMMKMLEAGGIIPLTDKIRAADADNLKGYYEWERVKKLPEGDTEWLAQAQGGAVKVISALVKFLPPTYSYNIVFMRREINEIMASQRQMLLRRGETGNMGDDKEMTALFQKHLQDTMTWLAGQPNMNVLYIHYNDALSNPTAVVNEVNSFLARPLDTKAMINVVDEQLYRQRQKA